MVKKQSKVYFGERVNFELYDKFLINIGINKKIRNHIFQDLTVAYYAEPIIYILQTVAKLSFSICCGLITAYLWKKTNKLEKRKRSPAASNVKKQMEKLKNEIELLKQEVNTKDRKLARMKNEYLQIAEVILNSTPEDIVKKVGVAKLRKLKKAMKSRK